MMTFDKQRLREEFVTTLSNALFKDVQEKLGVTDGGAAAMFWSGHDLVEATATVIGVRAPDFVIDEGNAFEHEWPVLAPIADLEPASLFALSKDYIAKIGEIVGADLSGGDLAAEHAVMLRQYVEYERSLAATHVNEASAAPRA